MADKTVKLNVKAMAFGVGTAWGFMMLFLGWAGALGWGAGLAVTFSSLYIGFGPSFLGGIMGAVWGFIDGAIGGAIIAWVYNKSVETCCRKKSK